MNQQAVDIAKDLPQELLDQLKLTSAPNPNRGARYSDRYKMILQAIRDNGGKANLNQILIGVYQKKKVVMRRDGLNYYIKRMVDAGDLERIKPGFYKLPKGSGKQPA